MPHNSEQTRNDANYKLEDKLKELKSIAKTLTVHTEPQHAKGMLEECGYDWFKISPGLSDDELKQQVKKVFIVAVNEAIQEKVDPVLVEEENGKRVLNRELGPLLEIGDASLDKYFTSFPAAPDMNSPRDLAKHLKSDLKSDQQKMVKNIIQHQFDIRWETGPPAGEPDDYTFYDLCDMENTKASFLYEPRKAHVYATLYKECRRKSISRLRKITKKKLCPKVFIRTPDGWKSWEAQKDEFSKAGMKECLWIKKPIFDYIKDNADEQKNETLKESLKKHTLYWAVIEDSDFRAGSVLKLNDIGKSQVYIGKANNGIKGRWLEDGGNHCEKMKECLDTVNAMTTYNPMFFKAIQLVDARLALAKVRGEEKEKTALFVMKTFGDDIQEKINNLNQSEEKLRDAKKQPENVATSPPGAESNAETQMSAVENKLSSLSLLDLEAAVEENKKELKDSKSRAKADLEKAEQSHRKGKREANSVDIISPDECRGSWKPTDMKFGMNAC